MLHCALLLLSLVIVGNASAQNRAGIPAGVRLSLPSAVMGAPTAFPLALAAPSLPAISFQGTLGPAQIEPLSSTYLGSGIKEDSFEIRSVEIAGPSIESSVRMQSFFTSPTDTGRFHLSAPLVMQILSQLGIIHGHVLMGLERKTTEVWLGEYEVRHRKPIRDPDQIHVVMNITDIGRGRSHPDQIVLTHDFDMNDGAVTGRTKLYFNPP